MECNGTQGRNAQACRPCPQAQLAAGAETIKHSVPLCSTELIRHISHHPFYIGTRPITGLHPLSQPNLPGRPTSTIPFQFIITGGTWLCMYVPNIQQGSLAFNVQLSQLAARKLTAPARARGTGASAPAPMTQVEVTCR